MEMERGIFNDRTQIAAINYPLRKAIDGTAKDEVLNKRERLPAFHSTRDLAPDARAGLSSDSPGIKPIFAAV